VTRFLLYLFLLHAAVQASSPAVTFSTPIRSRSPGYWQSAGNASPGEPQQPANVTPESGNQTPGNATAGNATPGNTTPGIDPAAATFLSPAGMIVVTVKPDKTADYEAVIVALQEALSQADDETTRTLAEGWRVFKATDLDAKANAIYIHLLDPAIADSDYRPSLWLDKLLDGAPLELLSKYRDAFAAAPTKLPLVELARMSIAPVAKPSNTSPDATTIELPANASPAATAKNGTPESAIKNETPDAPIKNGSPGEPLPRTKPGNGSPQAAENRGTR
jgi:hypothetical protein